MTDNQLNLAIRLGLFALIAIVANYYKYVGGAA